MRIKKINLWPSILIGALGGLLGIVAGSALGLFNEAFFYGLVTGLNFGLMAGAFFAQVIINAVVRKLVTTVEAKRK